MRKKIILSVVLILAVAGFLRFYGIGQTPPGLYPDEAMNGNNALESLSAGHFKVFYPENNGREGLFINIQALFLKFLMPFYGGPEPWMLRIASAFFGLFTVLGVYFLTKELFKESSKNEILALFASFLAATSFWLINFSRIGFRAIMAPFFLVWAIYFILLAIRKIKTPNHKSYILYSLLGGIVYGLGFYSYIAYRATPLLILVIGLIYWLKNKDSAIRKKILLSALLFFFSAVAVFAPLGLYFLHNPQDFFGRTAQISVFSSPTVLKDLGFNILKTAGMFNFAGDWNWRHNYAGSPQLFWPIGILFLIGIFLGLRMLFKKSFRNREENFSAFLILFSWMLISALPVIVSNESLPHALRSILMAPAAFIIAAFGGIWLYEKLLIKIQNYSIPQKVLIKVSLLMILSAFAFQAYYVYFIKWGQNPNTAGAFASDYIAIAKQLNSLPKETPKYVIVEAGGTDVRGLPMPTQTVMFITDTFTPEKQKEKNIFYVLPDQIGQIPLNAFVTEIK